MTEGFGGGHSYGVCPQPKPHGAFMSWASWAAHLTPPVFILGDWDPAPASRGLSSLAQRTQRSLSC